MPITKDMADRMFRIEREATRIKREKEATAKAAARGFLAVFRHPDFCGPSVGLTREGTLHHCSLDACNMHAGKQMIMKKFGKLPEMVAIHFHHLASETHIGPYWHGKYAVLGPAEAIPEVDNSHLRHGWTMHDRVMHVHKDEAVRLLVSSLWSSDAEVQVPPEALVVDQFVTNYCSKS